MLVNAKVVAKTWQWLIKTVALATTVLFVVIAIEDITIAPKTHRPSTCAKDALNTKSMDVTTNEI